MLRYAGRLSRSACATGAALVAMFLSASADAQTPELSVSADARGGYSTNPFLVNDNDTGSAFVELSIQPQAVQADALGEAVISANYRRTEYLRRYDGTDGYGANASARRKLSSIVTARASLSYDSSILGQGVTPGLAVVIDPNLPPGPVVPDITVLGIRRRVDTLAAAVGADWQLTQRDTVATDLQMSRVKYDGDSARLFSSRTTTGTVNYTRSLSARTSVGARVSGTWTDFQREGYDGAYYQTELTLHRQLTETIRVDLAGGLLFIRSETNGGRANSTGFSGSITACDENARQSICLRAYSGAQPTGFGDVSKTYGGSVDYSYRLTENDSVTAGATYSRVDTTSDLVGIPASTYVNANAALDHRISRRFSVGVDGAYRRIDGGFFDHTDDFSFRLYIRTRLGNVK